MPKLTSKFLTLKLGPELELAKTLKDNEIGLILHNVAEVDVQPELEDLARSLKQQGINGVTCAIVAEMVSTTIERYLLAEVLSQHISLRD